MQPMKALSRLPCEGILNAGDAAELKPMKNVGLALSFLASLWCCGSSTHAQEAVDLPGMDWVLMHHNLSMAELNQTWEDYAHEAVLITQGAALAQELKAGLRVLDLNPWPIDGWQGLLLNNQHLFDSDGVAIAMNEGSWLVLAPTDKIQLWTDRYILNSKAILK